jgi:hypothetical protein
MITRWPSCCQPFIAVGLKREDTRPGRPLAMAVTEYARYAVPASCCREVAVITGPDDGAAAGRGRLRASHADREHVIDTLKTAFADGRLDMDELADRVGQALAARTYVELATVTADIPAEPPQAPRPRRAARPPVNKEAVKWDLVAAGAMIPPAMFVTALFGELTPLALLAFPLMFIEMIVAIIFVTITLARQQKDRSRASRGQLPPQPGQPGQIAESERHGSTGHKPSPHPTRTGQTRVGLPVRKSWPDRPHHSGQAVPVSRGARLVPEAAWAATTSP